MDKVERSLVITLEYVDARGVTYATKVRTGVPPWVNYDEPDSEEKLRAIMRLVRAEALSKLEERCILAEWNPPGDVT